MIDTILEHIVWVLGKLGASQQVKQANSDKDATLFSSGASIMKMQLCDFVDADIDKVLLQNVGCG